MTFISDKQNRAYEQTATPLTEFTEMPSWWEGFSAAYGHVVDESLSISSGLNHDAAIQRRNNVRELGIDVTPYRNKRGRVDYDRISHDYDGIMSDKEVRQDRNAKLKARREYAKEVAKFAPKSSTIAGQLAGYVSDPLLIATMPYSMSVRGAQGLSVLSRALRVGGKSALIEGSAEAAIQGFVYQHRQDIESEYSASDAIESVAFAAGAGGTLGLFAGGIQGFLKKHLDSVDYDGLDDAEKTAYKDVERLASYLDDVAEEQQIDRLKEIEAFSNKYEQQPSVKNEYQQDLFGEVKSVAKPSVEKEVLQRAGLDESLDYVETEYNKLDTRVLFNDADDGVIDADEVINGVKEEINSIENIMRCVRG